MLEGKRGDPLLLCEGINSLLETTRVIFGDVANTHVAELTDLNGREWIVMGVLAFFVLLIGLWPAPLIEVMQTSVEALLRHVTTTKLIGIPG